MKLVFATNNSNKLNEIRAIVQSPIEILSLADISFREDIPETADTLEGNALIKAETIFKKFGMNCFSDDSGLEVAALAGEPGVQSARYAGPEQDAAKNMAKLLSAMNGKADRIACFRTVIALILDGKEYFFEGRIGGTITQEKHGAAGFGYDPVFRPEGFEKTFAEMSAAEKNRISHRAQAVNKLVDFLKHRVL
jgi:XTP/dITP diphosphohydrolase